MASEGHTLYGLIIIFIAGAQLVYQTISDAISYIATTMQKLSSKRCEYQGEFFGNPNSPNKTCSYKCKGYGASANFPSPPNQPCPPSFDNRVSASQTLLTSGFRVEVGLG